MGAKIPSYVIKNMPTSTTEDGKTVLGAVGNTQENKNTTSEILSRTAKNILPSVGKGLTHQIDKIADTPDYVVNAISQLKQKANPNSYDIKQKAKEAQSYYEKARDTHVFGEEVQNWEKSVDERQAQIVNDNPTSKAAQIGYKATELAESAGAMIPTIAISLATQGIGALATGNASIRGLKVGAEAADIAAAQTVGKIAEATGLGTMFMGVYSSSLDDSVAQGYDYIDSSNKAFLDATLEVATEKLFGGVLGLSKINANSGSFNKMMNRIATSSWADTIKAKSGIKAAGEVVIKTGLSIANFCEKYSMFGEAAEEMISAAVSPTIERWTTNPDAPNASIGEIIEAGIGGAILSVALSPIGSVTNNVFSTILTSQETNAKLNSVDQRERIYLDLVGSELSGTDLTVGEKLLGRELSPTTQKKGLFGITKNVKGQFSTNFNDTNNRQAGFDLIAKWKSEGRTAEGEVILQKQLSDLCAKDAQEKVDRVIAKTYEEQIRKDLALEKGDLTDLSEQVSAAESRAKTLAANLREAKDSGADTDTLNSIQKQLAEAQNSYDTLYKKYEPLMAKAEAKVDKAMAEADAVEKYGKDTVDSFNISQKIKAIDAGRIVEDGTVYTLEEYMEEKKLDKKAAQKAFQENRKAVQQTMKQFETDVNKALKESNLGNRLQLKLSDKRSDAWYINGTIYMNPSDIGSVEAGNYYLSHEVLHGLVDALGSAEAISNFYDTIIRAADVVGYDFNGMYNRIRNSKAYNKNWDAQIKENKTKESEASYKDRLAKEETVARFMSSAFASRPILQAIALYDPSVLKTMESSLKNSSLSRLNDSVWDYSRLKIIQNIEEALLTPVATEDNVKAIKTNIGSEIKEFSKLSDEDLFPGEYLSEYEKLKEKYHTYKNGMPKRLNDNVAVSKTIDRIIGDKFDNVTFDKEIKTRLVNAVRQGEGAHLILTDDNAQAYARERLLQHKKVVDVKRDSSGKIIKTKTETVKHTVLSDAYTDVMSLLDGKHILSKNEIAYAEQVIIEYANAYTEMVNDTATPIDSKNPTELFDQMQKVIVSLCSAGTRAGQNLQAFKLLKKLTPTGRLYYIESQTKALISELVDRKGQSRIGGYRFIQDGKGNYLRDDKGHLKPIKISDDLKAEMWACTTQAEMDAVEEKIIVDIASQIPPTLSDRVVAWRYLAMLGNPRTHIRNIVSNAVMGLAVKGKNAVGGALEDILLKDKTVGRTKTLQADSDKVLALKEFARDDWARDSVNEIAMSGGKVGFQTRIEQARNKLGIGKFNFIEDVSKGNMNWLETEDDTAGKRAYVDAFASYCAANGLTPEYFNNNDINSNTRLSQARAYAINEAAKATYHDFNILATYLNQIENKTGILGKLIVGGLVPFKKTPGNILKRGYDYSPISLVSGFCEFLKATNSVSENMWEVTDANGEKQLVTERVYEKEYHSKGGKFIRPADYTGSYGALDNVDAKDVGTVKYNGKDISKAEARYSAEAKKTLAVANAIDKMASGLTGTALLMLGYFLGHIGMLKGAGKDNDKEEYYDQMLGEQEYSITIGGQNFTLDWLTPVSMPLFSGVALADLFDGTLEINDVFSALSKLADPVMNLSVLSGLNDALEGYDAGLGQMLIKAGEGYIGQFIPTIAGQVARTIDPVRRTTYAPKDTTNIFGKEGATFLNKLENKIPGASQSNSAYIDMWGRQEVSDSGIVGRFFNNAIAPWYVKEINKTQTDDYVSKLFAETGDRSVIPSSPQSSLTYENEVFYLTSAEYQQSKEMVGKLSYQGITSLMNVPGFSSLSSDIQADLVSQVYSFTKKMAKNDYAIANKIDYNPGKSYERIINAVNAGLSLGEAVYINYIANNMEADKNSKGESISGSKKKKVLNFYRSMGLTNAQLKAISIYDLD